MLLNASSMYIELIMWFLSFLKLWCIILVDLQILNHPCLPGVHPTSSLGVTLPQLCSLLGSSGLCPSPEQCNRGQSEVLGLDQHVHWGSSGMPVRVPGSFCLLGLPCFVIKWACEHPLRVEVFHSSTGSLELVFKHVKETCPPCVGLLVWSAWYVVSVVHFPERISEPVWAPLSVVGLLETWILTWPLLLPSNLTLCGSSYSLGYIRVFLPVSVCFQWEVLHT